MDRVHDVRMIRDLVLNAFVELGLERQELTGETILIRDGHYVGRRFELDALRAVWFVQEGQVKFYDEQQLLKVVHLQSDPGEQRRAG